MVIQRLLRTRHEPDEHRRQRHFPDAPLHNAAIDAIKGPNGTVVCRSAAAQASGCLPLNVIGQVTVDPAALAYVEPANGPQQRSQPGGARRQLQFERRTVFAVGWTSRYRNGRGVSQRVLRDPRRPLRQRRHRRQPELGGLSGRSAVEYRRQQLVCRQLSRRTRLLPCRRSLPGAEHSVPEMGPAGRGQPQYRRPANQVQHVRKCDGLEGRRYVERPPSRA